MDKDESFQIEDFENLDESTAPHLNRKIEFDMIYFNDNYQDPSKKESKPSSANNKKDTNTKSSSSKLPKTINIAGIDLPIDLEPLEKIVDVSC